MRGIRPIKYNSTMKTITLCAINARYSHSSLALLYLQRAADGLPVSLAEFNINDDPAKIIESLVTPQPDAVGFSCYIWNIGCVLKVASAVKKLLPQCTILLGGPEVSFDAPELLRRHSFIDIIIRGAGETPFRAFAAAFCNAQSISATPSATLRTGGMITDTPDATPLPLADLPFVYNDDLSAYAHKIIYYETSRGCPFRCAYCLSAETSLDFLTAERAIRELEHFMRQGVQQVKLVDRTFNHPDSRAREIFAALIDLAKKYPDSPTNFHFEISASLLSDDTLNVLAKAPPGLLQFEVGIQSTHGDTLKAVGRGHSTRALLDKAARLCRMNNLCVHVDLIAGLPLETQSTFAASFNDAYRLGADQLQLGFLKLLKGSPLRAQTNQYGILYHDDAPYEVLETAAMSYADLRRLHRLESLVDALYNSRAARRTLALLTALLPPYDVFNRFTIHLENSGWFTRPQKAAALFEQLHAFAAALPGIDAPLLRESLAFDWLSHDKSDCPACFAPPQGDETKAFARRLLSDPTLAERCPQWAGLTVSQLHRRCRLAFFPRLLGTPSYVLFDDGTKPDAPDHIHIINV